MDLDRRQFLQAGIATVGGVLISGITDLNATEAATKPGADIEHGSRAKSQVALTFHGAGERALVQKLLGILKSTGTPISVFAVGTWLRDNPSDAKQILDAGYDLGNHTMHHYQMKQLGAAAVESEISECAAELRKLTGSQGKWFRPSGTQFSNATIRAAAVKHGYGPCISYDVDSHDYQDVGKKAVLADITQAIKPGSIVSMHFGHQDTVDAMPTILEDLQKKGLTPVTLSTLLA